MYAALQSEPGKRALQSCGRVSDDISSIVYIPDEINVNGDGTQTHFIKSQAVVEIVKTLGFPVGLVSNLMPMALKDEMYDTVAENRYNLMGKYDEMYDTVAENRYN